MGNSTSSIKTIIPEKNTEKKEFSNPIIHYPIQYRYRPFIH